MNQITIGTFIAKCRKEKKLTQAQLAEKLNITDRAVSKWETGKSMPDSSIMLELCNILGITVNELLSGEKIKMESYQHYEKKAEENLIALKKNDENHIKKDVIIAVLYTAILFIGIMVCLICDIAISGKLTWAPIPISSIVFAWAISFPGIIGRKKRIAASLISLSVFVIPYLYLLSHLIKVSAVFSIGAAMAVITVLFLWIVYAIFLHIGKTRKSAACGIIFLSGVLLVFIINAVLSKMIEEPLLDVWDILTVFILLVSAGISFLCDHSQRRKTEGSTTR